MFECLLRECNVLSSLSILLWEWINTDCISSLQATMVSFHSCCLLIPPSVFNDLSLTVLLADVRSDI